MYRKSVAICFCFVFVAVLFTVGCSAQTESQALERLRELTRDGQLPAESVVADIEKRFAGKRTGALAKLLHARIKYENKDFAGAALLLDSSEFNDRTKVGDYALWMRGRSLQQAGDHSAALKVFEKLRDDFPQSLHLRNSRFRSAESAIAAGRSQDAIGIVKELADAHRPEGLLWTARALEAQSKQREAIEYFRLAYFHGSGTETGTAAEKKLTELGEDLTPRNSEEYKTRAEMLFAAKKWPEAHSAYAELAEKFPMALTPPIRLQQVTAAVQAKKMPDAQAAFDSLPAAAAEREEGYFQLVTGYAANRLWPQTRAAAEEMRAKFPQRKLTPKAWVNAGYAARDAKNKLEESYFLRTALTAFPQAIEVAGAQFELAWLEHEAKNFARAADLMIEHLVRYADKDTTNRGRAGYWAARNSELAGRIDDACSLYEALNYRYSANWYGHLGTQRVTALRSSGQCNNASPANSAVAKAAANLKSITVAPETSGPDEQTRIEKGLELSTVGLFDWSIDELEEAKKTAANSPRINLALAQHYQLKGDNVSALLALAKSYPDYSQMFPEEMGRDEWKIFYPHVAWDQISAWAKHRNLDLFQVAGLIRQESVFNPRARSGANAYGLMQLILPTAKTMARKYGASVMPNSGADLFQPALNIELGTAYMRDQLDKFGRIEYMAVAYNAGPGRVPQWRASLPLEMDEFVEAIPFRETKGYVQGIIRNTAQYRRLYDANGNFLPAVGTRELRTQIDSRSREQLATEFPDIVLDGDSSSE